MLVVEEQKPSAMEVPLSATIWRWDSGRVVLRSQIWQTFREVMVR